MMSHFALALLTCAMLLTSCNHSAASGTKTSVGGDADAKPKATPADNYAKPKADADSPGANQAIAAAVPVQTVVVHRGALPQLVVGYGIVGGGANPKADLAFSEAGRIASVDVTVGDRVSSGMVLARLDPRPFQAELDQARANVAAAQAAQTKARLGVRPQQVAETDAQTRQAKTQVRIAQAQADREAKLLSLGIAAQSDVDTARAALANAKGQLEVLQQQRLTEVHPWQPDVDAANAGVAQAQSVASGASQKVAVAQLVAPFAGVVVARLHNDGESVDATTPVVELVNAVAPIFTAQFTPEDASRIHVGDPATIEAQGAPLKTDGIIAAINAAQGDAHTVAVLVRMRVASQPTNTLSPGAYGKASVRVGTQHGLIVPEPAIVTDAATGAVQVFRKEDERFEPVPITVEARVAGRAIVVAPNLHPGDRVATRGAYELLTPQQAPKADSD